MTLVLRKRLASSTFAIAAALTSMADRLRAKSLTRHPDAALEDHLEEDYEALDETVDEWEDDLVTEDLSDATRAVIEQEIADLRGFARLASSIQHNVKGKS